MNGSMVMQQIGKVGAARKHALVLWSDNIANQYFNAFS